MGVSLTSSIATRRVFFQVKLQMAVTVISKVSQLCFTLNKCLSYSGRVPFLFLSENISS